MYRIVKFDEQEVLVLVETMSFIPKDYGNRHYQEYLAWIAEGNEPEIVEVS